MYDDIVEFFQFFSSSGGSVHIDQLYADPFRDRHFFQKVRVGFSRYAEREEKFSQDGDDDQRDQKFVFSAETAPLRSSFSMPAAVVCLLMDAVG